MEDEEVCNDPMCVPHTIERVRRSAALADLVLPGASSVRDALLVAAVAEWAMRAADAMLLVAAALKKIRQVCHENGKEPVGCLEMIEVLEMCVRREGDEADGRVALSLNLASGMAPSFVASPNHRGNGEVH